MTYFQHRDKLFTLDASDWPLIINRGDEVFATLPEPKDLKAAEEKLRIANRLVHVLNHELKRGTI